MRATGDRLGASKPADYIYSVAAAYFYIPLALLPDFPGIVSIAIPATFLVMPRISSPDPAMVFICIYLHYTRQALPGMAAGDAGFICIHIAAVRSEVNNGPNRRNNGAVGCTGRFNQCKKGNTTIPELSTITP